MSMMRSHIDVEYPDAINQSIKQINKKLQFGRKIQAVKLQNIRLQFEIFNGIKV